jgi:hypothetical protein
MSDCNQLAPKGLSYETLLAHLPRGVAWLAARVPGKNLYKLWVSFSDAYEDAVEAMCKLPVELNPYTTTELITEWEAAVGLPDACLPAATTLAERRKYVIFRLSKRRWTTEQDWKDLAELFGLTITVTPGWRVQKPALYPFCYPKSYLYLERLGRFHVFIDVDGGCGDDGYAYDYPHTYGSGERCELFKCIIDKVKPANVVVIWNNTPPITC